MTVMKKASGLALMGAGGFQGINAASGLSSTFAAASAAGTAATVSTGTLVGLFALPALMLVGGGLLLSDP